MAFLFNCIFFLLLSIITDSERGYSILFQLSKTNICILFGSFLGVLVVGNKLLRTFLYMSVGERACWVNDEEYSCVARGCASDHFKSILTSSFSK